MMKEDLAFTQIQVGKCYQDFNTQRHIHTDTHSQTHIHTHIHTHTHTIDTESEAAIARRFGRVV